MTDPDLDLADLRIGDRWPPRLRAFWVHHWRGIPGKDDPKSEARQKVELGALVITAFFALSAVGSTILVTEAAYDFFEPRRPAVAIAAGDGKVLCSFAWHGSPVEIWLSVSGGEPVAVGQQGTVTVPGRRLDRALWNPSREVGMRRHFYTSAGCLAALASVLTHAVGFFGGFFGLYPSIYRWLAARSSPHRLSSRNKRR